jgi:hypothetical protein
MARLLSLPPSLKSHPRLVLDLNAVLHIFVQGPRVSGHHVDHDDLHGGPRVHHLGHHRPVVLRPRRRRRRRRLFFFLFFRRRWGSGQRVQGEPEEVVSTRRGALARFRLQGVSKRIL